MEIMKSRAFDVANEVAHRNNATLWSLAGDERTKLDGLVAALKQLEWKAGNHVAALEAIGREANGLKAACEMARAALAKAST